MIILALGILCGILYRMGGSGNWNSKARDVGCSLVVLLCIFYACGACVRCWWIYLLVFGLSWGALSSYHYFLPKPKDYTSWHFALHGAVNALACFPLIFCGIAWQYVVIRMVMLALLLGVWHWKFNKPAWKFSSDIVQEFGRGFFIATTVSIL